MKKWVLGGSLILLVILVIAGSYLLAPKAQAPQKSSLTPTVSQSPSPTLGSSTQTSFCSPTDLQAGIALDGAAGNIYGILTLKNVSQNPCNIIGNNKLLPTSSAKNVTYNYYPAAGQDTILLSPNQSVYSKVHYPNGPQCQTGIVTSSISFSYQISPTSQVTFMNQDGNAKQNITTCVGATNMTQVDMWSLSTTPQQ